MISLPLRQRSLWETSNLLAQLPSASAATRPIPRCVFRHSLPPTRHVATSRRTTKALRVKPAPSAAPASKRVTLVQNTIVFNPPPTPPSPYQTPPLFLPPSDPRRSLLAPSYSHDNPYRRSDPTSTSTLGANEAENIDPDLPPAIGQLSDKKYHLGAADIEEIRKLRTSNPWIWTKKRLAEKFGCSEYFVAMCAQAVPERVDWAKDHLEQVKLRWGPKRTKARQDRVKRRRMWQRDE